MDIEDEANATDLATCLRHLGPRYGFSLSLLTGTGGEGGVTLVLVAPAQEEGVREEDVRRQADLLAQEVCRLCACTRPAYCAFTPAELEVLRWIRAGRSNRDIARILNKSEFTVKTHVQNMLQKSELDNRVQLARLDDTQFKGTRWA
jgi:DNA-binding CsgD family transcriptional regulator